MTTPSGFPRSALQWFGAARGAVADRVNTGGFYQALRDAGATFGAAQGGLSFGDVNQLRSSAAALRNAQEAFQRAPDGSGLDASHIGVTPYARSLADRNAVPIFHVGINLTTADMSTGQTSTDYRIVQFTGSLPSTKGELMEQLANDAQGLADTYGATYVGHDVVEVLAA